MAKYYDAETGQELGDDELESAFASGRLAVDTSDAPIIVRDPNGTRLQLTGDDAAGKLGDYLTNGYAVETAAQTAQTQMRLEAGAQPLQAGAEAIARGVTLGLSDVAGEALLGDDYAQRAAIRKDSLEGYGTGIEIAAGVLPALATGGTSLGARALAATPAGLVARGSAALGSSLERTLVARGVGQGVARLAGMVAEGGADGALSGVGEALSEASLGNVEVTAENLLASGGLGALLGAGAGGLFGGASMAAGKSAREIADRLAARSTGETVERGAREGGFFKYVKDKATDAVITRGSQLLNIDEATLRRGFDEPSVRADLLNADQVKETFNKRLRDDAQQMLDNAVHVRRVYAGDIKSSNLKNDVRVGAMRGEDALQSAEEIISKYETRLSELADRGLLTKQDAKRIDSDLHITRETLKRNLGALADESGEAWRAYQALENLKRSADQTRKRLSGKASGSVAEREGIPALQAEVGELGDNLRKLLEREDLFGEAGAKQAARNAALHKALQTSKEFQGRLVRGTGESVEPDYWEIEKVVLDGDKADGFINNLLNPNREYTNDQVKRHLNDMADMYDTVLRNDDVPDELVGRFRDAAEGARRMLKTIDEAEQRLGVIGKFEAAAKAEQELGGLVGGVGNIAAIVGGFAGGGIGAAAGAATGKALNIAARPVSMLRAMARMEAISARSKGVQTEVRQTTSKAVRRLMAPRNERKGIGLARAAMRIPARVGVNERSERRKKARDIETKLLALQSDPLPMVEALGYQTAELATVAPGTALALAQQANRAVEFLRSKLPPPSTTPHLLQPQLNQRTWDAASIDKFERYLETVKDPQSALVDLSRGKLTSEQVEVLKAVYPSLYNEMRVTVAAELAAHGQEMPFDSVVQLSLLMDVTGHPSLTSEYQAVLAQAREKNSQGGGPDGPRQATVPPSKFKPMTVQKSLSERLAGGLESR